MMADDETPITPEAPEEKPAPKRRRTRKKAEDVAQASAATEPDPAVDASSTDASGEGAQEAAPELDSVEEDFEEDPILALQRDILDAALPHACIDGWTREMLALAASDAGLPEGEAERAFPRGGIDALLAYVRFVDDDMVAELEDLEQTEPAVYENMRTREKIAIAIQVRLESQYANRDAVAKGLRLLADPRYAAEVAKSLARTVDAVWRLAGDTSTDFNFYSKRGLLAGVYSATLLYWLNDNSEDQYKTWEFMRSRIGEVLKVGQATAGFAKVADRLPNPFRLCATGKRRWREGPVFR